MAHAQSRLEQALESLETVIQRSSPQIEAPISQLDSRLAGTLSEVSGEFMQLWKGPSNPLNVVLVPSAGADVAKAALASDPAERVGETSVEDVSELSSSTSRLHANGPSAFTLGHTHSAVINSLSLSNLDELPLNLSLILKEGGDNSSSLMARASVARASADSLGSNVLLALDESVNSLAASSFAGASSEGDMAVRDAAFALPKAAYVEPPAKATLKALQPSADMLRRLYWLGGSACLELLASLPPGELFEGWEGVVKMVHAAASVGSGPAAAAAKSAAASAASAAGTAVKHTIWEGREQDISQQPPLAVVLAGPPGSSKREVAERIAAYTGASLCQRFLASADETSLLRTAENRILYGCPSSRDMWARLISKLIEVHGKDNVVVVLATCSPAAAFGLLARKTSPQHSAADITKRYKNERGGGGGGEEESNFGDCEFFTPPSFFIYSGFVSILKLRSMQEHSLVFY